MNKSDSIIELAKALAKFQGEVKQPVKDGHNPHFQSNFITLDGVVAAITETASKHGLSFMQFPLNEDDKIGIKTLIMHESGEYLEADPVYARPMKNDPQAIGSVITYLKRYSLSAIFGITSDVDNDAEGAMDHNQSKQSNYSQQSKSSYTPPASNIPVPQTAAEGAMIVSNFGKHKGKTLGVIFGEDLSYLTWMQNAEKTDEAIKVAIKLMKEAKGIA